MFTSISDLSDAYRSLLKTSKTKERETATNSSKGTAIEIGKTDSFIISEEAKLIKSANLSLPDSFLATNNEEFTFSFDFSSDSYNSLTANGFYSRKEKTLNLAFSYVFDKEVVQDGKKTLKKFKADLNFNFNRIDESSITKNEKKEDMVDFIHRIVNEMMNKINSKRTFLDGVAFDAKDMEELIGLGKDELGRKLLHVLSLVFAIAKMQSMMNKDKDAEGVIIVAKRKKEIETEIKKSLNLNSDFKISISEIKDNESAAKTEAKVEKADTVTVETPVEVPEAIAEKVAN